MCKMCPCLFFLNPYKRSITPAVIYPVEIASLVEGKKSLYEALVSSFFDNSSKPPTFTCLPPRINPLFEHLYHINRLSFIEFYLIVSHNKGLKQPLDRFYQMYTI